MYPIPLRYCIFEFGCVDQNCISALLVFVVHAACQLTGVRSVDNGAMLPLFITREISLEVESVVDIAEAKFEVMMLQRVSRLLGYYKGGSTYTTCSLSLSDAVDIARNLLPSACKLD